MPVFQLTDQIHFPNPQLAEESGLLAVGGDLSPERLLYAYSQGIFPWYSQGDPILWWFTSPRLIIHIDEFRIPKRVARYRKNSNSIITRNQAFAEVIKACGDTRTQTGEETWILPEIQAAYLRLHKMGYAHSIECWQDQTLTGGLYGIAIDRVFFGESMFSIAKSASQFALIGLIDYLKADNFKIIDCQMTTNHLLRFGAKEISGQDFQETLKTHINDIKPNENWKNRSHIGQ